MPAAPDDRAQVERRAKAVQAATDDSVEVALVDQGYIGQTLATLAHKRGLELRAPNRTGTDRAGGRWS